MATDYNINMFVKEILINQSNNTGLQQSFIGVIATIIAILFSILITIVANSSSKYPSNFIRKITRDKGTYFLYGGFGFIMLLEVIFYHLNLSNIFIDGIIMLIIIVSLYSYWRHILNLIDPELTVEKINEKSWNAGEKTKQEIKQIGDYVTIGLKNENAILTNKAFDKLLNFNERLKK